MHSFRGTNTRPGTIGCVMDTWAALLLLTFFSVCSSIASPFPSDDSVPFLLKCKFLDLFLWSVSSATGLLKWHNSLLSSFYLYLSLRSVWVGPFISSNCIWVYEAIFAIERKLWHTWKAGLSIFSIDVFLLLFCLWLYEYGCVRVCVWVAIKKFMWACLDTISLTELLVTFADLKAVWCHTRGDTINAEEAADRDTQASTLAHTEPDSEANDALTEEWGRVQRQPNRHCARWQNEANQKEEACGYRQRYCKDRQHWNLSMLRHTCSPSGTHTIA